MLIVADIVRVVGLVFVLLLIARLVLQNRETADVGGNEFPRVGPGEHGTCDAHLFVWR